MFLRGVSMRVNGLGSVSPIPDSQYLSGSDSENYTSEYGSESGEVYSSEASEEEVSETGESDSELDNEKYHEFYNQLGVYEERLEELINGMSNGVEQTCEELRELHSDLEKLELKILGANPAYSESLIKECEKYKSVIKRILESKNRRRSHSNPFYIDPEVLIAAYNAGDKELIQAMHNVLNFVYFIPTEGGLAEILPLLAMKNRELFPTLAGAPSSSSEPSTSGKPRRSFEEWLWKPVHKIKNDGTKQSKQLQDYLIDDLKGIEGFNPSLDRIKQAVFSLWRYFSHNCTYDPLKGYGFSSAQDRLNPLVYRRSQAKGVPDKIGCSKELTDIDKLYLAFILGPNWANKKLSEGIKRHIGLIVKSHGLLEQRVQEITDKRGAFDGSIVPGVVVERFLSSSYDFTEISNKGRLRLDFLRKDFKHRANVVTDIVIGCQDGLKNLRVFSAKGSPNVSIQILPDHININWNNYLEKTAWIDTCLTFFAGLLNHLCIQEGLLISTSRRQSFGFLRPTLTDVGTTIRLSVGCVPLLFSDVVIDSIYMLDEAITEITKEENLIFQAALIGIEAPLHNVKGNFFVVSMRENKRVAFLANDSMRFVNEDLLDYGFGDFILTRIFVDTFKEKYKGQSQAFEEAMPMIMDSISRLNQEQIGFLPEGLDPIDPIEDEELWEEISQVRDYSFSHEGIDEEMLLRLDDSSMLLQLNRLVIYLSHQLSEWDRVYREKIQSKQAGLPHTFSYCFDKLYNCYNNGRQLAAFTARYQHLPIVVAHFHSKAQLLVEKMLENIIGIKSIDAFENLSPAITPDKKLADYFNTRPILGGASSFFFRTISGQSALSLGLAVASRMVHAKSLDEVATDRGVYLDGAPYYEVEKLLEKLRQKNGKRKIAHFTDQKIILVDPCPTIKDAKELEHRINLTKLFVKVESKGVLIVDVTNMYLFSKRIDDLIRKWKEKEDRWLIFASSLLKHEQMGADKFQAGRLIILKPKDEFLVEEEKERFRVIEQELNHISASGINPIQESFFDMIQEILYPLPQADLPSSSYSSFSMNNRSSDSSDESESSDNEPPPVPVKSSRRYPETGPGSKKSRRQ